MKLHILFGQRKESYEGEYAPESLTCWSEYAVDENPEGFEQACDKARALHEDFVAFRVIRVDVDGNAIRDLLLKAPTIDGRIQ